MHIDFQRVTSLPILVPVLPKPSNVPHYTWNFERAEGTLNVAEFAKHEIRNPKQIFKFKWQKFKTRALMKLSITFEEENLKKIYKNSHSVFVSIIWILDIRICFEFRASNFEFNFLWSPTSDLRPRVSDLRLFDAYNA
jgi:hypothetical protein